MLVLGSLGAYRIYGQLSGNLNVVNAFGGLKNRPPAGATGVENILLLGSQTRDGQVGGRGMFGTDPGTDLSDNLILVHLDAAHTHATVVSIPRDVQVYEPACKSRFGNTTVPAIPNAIIDGAMNQGGPACAIATVEHLTDIRIDHFVRFTFNSFRDMTDILGGVEVCLRQAVNDPFSHLHMSAGRHLVTGNEALAFVRTRHGVGNGGDLGRIELQQQFISSLIQKIQSNGTLSNPLKLFDIAKVATKSLTVDPGLGTASDLLKQGYGLRSLHQPGPLDGAERDRPGQPGGHHRHRTAQARLRRHDNRQRRDDRHHHGHLRGQRRRHGGLHAVERAHRSAGRDRHAALAGDRRTDRGDAASHAHPRHRLHRGQDAVSALVEELVVRQQFRQ
jgi:LCP family protein required for cell wall assembly